MTSATTQAALPPFAREATGVVAGLGSDESEGLSASEAAARFSRHGANEIAKEPSPSVWQVALQQLRDPMNIMLIAVTAVSFAIGEVSTGVIVALLILLNVVLGSRQEPKARASIDALARLQVPQAKVTRDGALTLVPARAAASSRSLPPRGSCFAALPAAQRKWIREPGPVIHLAPVRVTFDQQFGLGQGVS